MAQLKEPPKPEPVNYELSQKPNSADIQFIKARIKAYNDKASAQHRARRQEPDTSLCSFLRDEQGKITAGLVAKLYWNWLYIDELWVAEELRGQGHGRSMMQQVKQAAIAQGAVAAQVKTWSFQALGFYEKLNYKVAGQMEDYPPGETFYWLRKQLT